MTEAAINENWLYDLEFILLDGLNSAPRGQPIKELIGQSYTVIDLKKPLVTLSARKMNFKFALTEAAWICSGRNDLEMIAGALKSYGEYSDDGFYLNGAYGPKFVDQVHWAVDTLAKDTASRQAVISLWRERPGPSKDIPCTLNLQFFIRENALYTVVNMRSSDAFWGFCYDSFTFACMSKVVQILLAAHGIDVDLGQLQIHAGSIHLYKRFYEKAEELVSYLEKDDTLETDAFDFKVLTNSYSSPAEFTGALLEYAKAF